MSVVSTMVSERHRLLTRAVQTLIGICNGLVADGELNDHEICFLKTWILENNEVLTAWPGDVIGKKVEVILADGTVTSTEREELLDLLRSATMNSFVETGAASPDAPSALAVDDSVEVGFHDSHFCFSGKFLFGTKNACMRATTSLGGIVEENMTQIVDYLVIGSLVKNDWAYPSHGRKIEQAATLRQVRGKPMIISEERWIEAVKKAAL
jgi:hypothetical protein